VHPTLEALEDVLANLYQVVDSRVYVAVGRGLWDCTSQDVYEYLEGLQEGLGLNRVSKRTLLRHMQLPISLMLPNGLVVLLIEI